MLHHREGGIPRGPSVRLPHPRAPPHNNLAASLVLHAMPAKFPRAHAKPVPRPRAAPAGERMNRRHAKRPSRASILAIMRGVVCMTARELGLTIMDTHLTDDSAMASGCDPIRWVLVACPSSSHWCDGCLECAWKHAHGPHIPTIEHNVHHVGGVRVVLCVETGPAASTAASTVLQ